MPQKKGTYDDTSSDGVEQGEKAELRRRGRGSRSSYRAFIKDNKKFWMCFNLIVMFACIVFGIGTYFILQMEVPKCGVLDFTLYILMIFHLVNFVVCFFNLCGLEMKICNGTLVCVLVIFEFGVLLCMQFVYFDAMR